MTNTIPAEVVEHLRNAGRVAVLTGAGVSAESGLPTFRHAQTGLWSRYNPTELATPEAFLRNPRLVWDWYAYRRQMARESQPNPAHYALVTLEQHAANFTRITQNIDGLHRRAGSQAILELHGNLERVRRFDSGTVVETWDDDGQTPPRCPETGELLRPSVVWFGEELPQQELRMAYSAAEQSHLFLAIGTSAMVQPAASLPMIAKRAGAYVIEVNPEETALSVVADCRLRGKAGVVLPILVRQAFGETEEAAG
jgi:NAD-dependent deacetylase